MIVFLLQRYLFVVKTIIQQFGIDILPKLINIFFKKESHVFFITQYTLKYTNK